MAIRDPLLLACRYFDRGLAGYFDEADLREIALMAGDHLSRERPARPACLPCCTRPHAIP